MTRARILAGTCLSLALLAAAPALAQDTPRYQPWSGGTAGSTQDMVKALRDLVAEAERARAADPRFLADLKALADSFDQTAPVQLIEDDFRDGDYTKGVVWTVRGGRWWVENAVGLRSVVAAPAASPAANAQPAEQPQRRSDDLAEAILGGILDKMSTGQKSESSQQSSTPAATPSGADTVPAEIVAQGAIPNAFAMRAEITSRARYGEFRLGPYQVSVADGWGYLVAYAPGAKPALRLLRFARGQYTVIAYHDATLDLEDGRLHVIDWTRSPAGAMTVALDGKTLIQATDLGLRDAFEGFAIGNRGGDYAVRSISVRRAP